MIESQIKKLKINSTNIKNSLFKFNKELIKLKKDKIKLNTLQQNRLKIGKKEKSIESSFKQSVGNIGKKLISYPMSFIDKFKEFFGLILLGILVNNLPKIIEGLQTVLGKIKDFLDKNPLIVSAIKFGFNVILAGIVGLAKVIKNLRPVIGGSFKFALDTLKSTKEQVGTLISMFSDLENTSVLLMQLVGLYDPPKPTPKPRPSSVAIKRAKSTPTASGGSYSPNTGYTYNPNFKNAAQATGVLAPKGGVMGTMIPGQKNTWREYGPKEDPNVYKQNVQRYNTLKPQGYAQGGTIGGFFSRLFGGGSRRGLGNIPPKEGTYRGSPSDIMRGKDASIPTRTPFASPGGTTRGRKARQAINAFKMFEMNVDQESLNLEGREKSYDLFGEFTKQFKFLSELREKYGEPDAFNRPRTPPGTRTGGSSSGEAIVTNIDEVIGTLGTTGKSTGPHIHIENATTRGGNIPPDVKRNILIDGKNMIDALYGPEDGNDGIGNYSWRRSANNPQGYHAGEDFADPQGKIGAKITLTGGLKFLKYIPDDGGGYGNRVLIESPDGTQYTLNHLNSGPANLAELKRRQKEQLAKRIPGRNNAEKVWNFFRSKGLSEIAVAGIMGNAQRESGFDPSSRGIDMGPTGDALGLFQWGENERWVNLTKWAKTKNKNPWDIDTQLQFSWESEINGPYKSVVGALQNAKTPSEAAEIWRRIYEGSVGTGPDVKSRKDFAEQWYKRWKGKKVRAPQAVLSPAQQLEKNIIEKMKSEGLTETTVGGYRIKRDNDKLTVTTVGGAGLGSLFQQPKVLPKTQGLLQEIDKLIKGPQASIQGLQTSKSLSTNAIDPLEESEVAILQINATKIVREYLPIPT